MADAARHWIDGAWSEAGEIAATVAVYTGADHGRVRIGGEAVAEAAIAAARRAFDRTG